MYKKIWHRLKECAMFFWHFFMQVLKSVNMYSLILKNEIVKYLFKASCLRPCKPYFRDVPHLSYIIPVNRGFKKEKLTDLYLYVVPLVSIVRQCFSLSLFFPVVIPNFSLSVCLFPATIFVNSFHLLQCQVLTFSIAIALQVSDGPSKLQRLWRYHM